ncbi:hypothetical protein BN1723_010012 [Verticillium longisporum]|uniref:Uncharacterized protein n=2 Tax=Verticillium longisporum TaxID=100787 RepID=A0A0G4KUF6_VERLO|nr:hypothetical protein HYQ44_004832 [Verticillium longisporum]CRK13429.1 hypothetical protein BN1723_010012 [Verticillium longisporum]
MDDSDDPQFIGYFLDGPATERLTLSSGTSWSSSSTIAGECSTSPCVLAVDCTNNILTLANNDKRTCAESFACETMTIYETYPFGKPSAKNYKCRLGWSAHTIYRAFAEETTTSLEPPAPTDVPSVTPSPNRSTTPDTDPQTSSVASAETQEANFDQGETSGSKAWIAGAVAGPIVGLAVLAFVFWLGMRHQRRKKVPADEAAAAGDKPRELHEPLYSPALSELPGHGSPNGAMKTPGASS